MQMLVSLMDLLWFQRRVEAYACRQVGGIKLSILEVGKIALVPLQETDLPAVYELNMDYDICSGAGFG